MREWVTANFPMSVDEFLAYAAYSGGQGTYSNSWVGGHVDALVTQRGEPYITLEARPRYGEYRGGVPAVSYVYAPDGSSGQACYDTYVVQKETGVVLRYYCR